MAHYWTPEEDAYLRECLDRSKTAADAARLFLSTHPDLSFDAARVRAQTLRARPETPVPDPEGEGYILRWTEHQHIEGDVAVAGDFQIPFFHREAVEKLLAVSARLNVTQLAVGGDFFDVPYWSTYDQTQYDQRLNWDADKKVGRDLLHALADQFERIYIVADNHFRRALRKLNFKTSFRGLYGDIAGDSLFDRIIASEYPIAEINKTWLVVHPAAYRQMKLSLASDLALKYEKNVINFHGHLAAMGFSKYGNYIIADGACMTDAQLHEYVMMHPTPHPTWNVGFYIVKGNWLHPFWLHKNFDWSFWLGEPDGQNRDD